MLDPADYSNLNDEIIAEKSLKNTEFFGILMTRYKSKLLSYILKISDITAAEAEDLLQDTFIKAYLNLNSFNPQLKFSSWIYRIAHNEVINHYHKNKNKVSLDYNLSPEIVARLINNYDAGRVLDQSYLAESIKKALAAMDLKYREVLILKFWEEKDYQEISDILKKPLGTVSTLVSRAKIRLAEELKKNNFKY